MRPKTTVGHSTRCSIPRAGRSRCGRRPRRPASCACDASLSRCAGSSDDAMALRRPSREVGEATSTRDRRPRARRGAGSDGRTCRVAALDDRRGPSRPRPSSKIVNGTTAPSSSATIQRMGRPNGNVPLPSSSQASQLMRLGKARPRSRAASTAGQHLAPRRGRPSASRGEVDLAGRGRILGRLLELIDRRRRSSWRSPGRRPSRRPAASRATLSDGPQTLSSRSACRARPAP